MSWTLRLAYCIDVLLVLERLLDMATSSSQSPDTRISSTDAIEYWNSISPTVSGMLGGYPQISYIDLRGSTNFLAKLRRQHGSAPGQGILSRGADCGAGIGRVTAGFLSKVCEVIDIVEPIQKFAEEVKKAEMTGSGKIGKTYVMGLENWEPDGKYDLMWNQWCLGHLTDKQLVAYLERCKKAIVEAGWIVVKENMSTAWNGEDMFDEMDSTMTRTDGKFRELFKEAGLRIVKSELQAAFPRSLLPVRFYALQPEQS